MFFYSNLGKKYKVEFVHSTSFPVRAELQGLWRYVLAQQGVSTRCTINFTTDINALPLVLQEYEDKQ